MFDRDLCFLIYCMLNAQMGPGTALVSVNVSSCDKGLQEGQTSQYLSNMKSQSNTNPNKPKVAISGKARSNSCPQPDQII